MVKRVIISIFLAHCVSSSVFSQTNDSIQVSTNPIDSVAIVSVEKKTNLARKNKSKVTVSQSSQDTAIWLNEKIELDKTTKKTLKMSEPFKPNPTKAVLYSAIFPGLGQIYNRKYWKLPIVYGGVIGLIYAITWNGRMYSEYTNAYVAIMSDNYIERAEDYIHIFSADKDPSAWSASTLQNYRESIRRRRDFNRRNRDLSIIAAVGVYALCMIDSYVDAQLYDFNMSPDLSFRVEPRIGFDNFSQLSIGVQCSVKF